MNNYLLLILIVQSVWFALWLWDRRERNSDIRFEGDTYELALFKTVRSIDKHLEAIQKIITKRYIKSGDFWR